MKRIKEKAVKGARLDAGELEALHQELSLSELGVLAHAMRMQRADPARVTYIKDRNINYTNICVSGCRFCAFFRPPGHRDGYVIDQETLREKIEETLELGGVQILLQGGLNPDLGLDYYRDLLAFIKEGFDIHVHGFSPPEIVHIAGLEGMTIRETILALKESGLDSIPGGGAEILTADARMRVSPAKCSADEWFEVMRSAHEAGLKTTATMMFGHGETLPERIVHLLRVRALQDETAGFTAFIPWSFQPGHTELEHIKPAGGHEYLKMLATSRLALDNFANIQLSWVTQGERVGQVALFFGANDFGSTMIEENVVAAAGTAFRMSAHRIEGLIRSAGFIPCCRNQAYEIIGEDPLGPGSSSR
jgi:cyclic dehypoxanthinyl futalosine synthase